MRKNLILSVLLLSSFISFSQGNNGLVAHWNFNGTANDQSGHGLNGIVTGTTSVPGYNNIPNTAFRFNGNGDHIKIPYNSIVNLDSFSICTLIKPQGFYAGASHVNMIINRGQAINGDNYSLNFSPNMYDTLGTTFTPSQERFMGYPSTNVSNYTNSQLLAAPAIDTNTWYCLTYIYGHDTSKLIINGTVVWSVHFPENYAPSNSDFITIGYYAADSVNFPYWLNGIIDDIRIYNRPLSIAEATQYCDTAKLNPTDVQQLNMVNPEILIYPNPAHNSISVQLPYNAPGSLVQIFNTMGQLITTIRPNSSLVSIDLSILPAGMYYIKANCDGLTLNQRFLKE